MKNSFLLVIFGFHLQYLFCVSDDSSGFISIDCGSGKSSTYKGLQYSTDAGFIDSGENHDILAGFTAGNTDQMLNLRSFPVGKRNCYNLSVAAVSKGNKYLIRAHFLYGNYDIKNNVPQFDLYLGVEKWDTINTGTPGKYMWWEIIHVATTNYVYVCLVNTGGGIPYISALELRPLKAKVYDIINPQDTLKNVQRSYFAPGSSNQVLRYPDDLYDRMWSPFPTPTEWIEIKSTSPIISNSNMDNGIPPLVVLQSAVTPKDNNSNLNLNFNLNGDGTNTSFLFCFYFSEVEQHDQSSQQQDQAREFGLYRVGTRLQLINSIKLTYLQEVTTCTQGITNQTDLNFMLQKSTGSVYPPVISGLERFTVTKFLQAQTDENDVFAVVNIKATYGLNKLNWQGDPCLPREFLWEGLDCVTFNNQSTPPTIKYLDLSSSGVSGSITPYLSQLKSLEFLDLSHNKLSGQIPDFLAELPSLKVLNLSGNNFDGSIPQKLTDKANNGSLLFRLEHNAVRHKKSLAKILALSSVALLLILGIALFIIFRKRIMNPDTQLFLGITQKKDVDMGDRSDKFTMAEIKRMTKKFKNPIGKGGFGEVFRGTMTDGTKVAVKVLSKQGNYQLEAEVKLLKSAYHENLTPILGYCDEGQDCAIVYKYMPNGSLNKFLSTDSKIVLTWRQRLGIALGATRGLLYLHECNLIHRDVKPENILLDEKLEAKLGDYGLVRETMLDKTHDTTLVQGTQGYVDPEYSRNDHLREKSDVYSMGVVLLRLITGQPLGIRVGDEQIHITQRLKDVDVKDNKQMRAIVDPKLRGKFDLESVQKAFTLATNCAAFKSDSRPTMSEVVEELEKCLKLARGQLTNLE